MTDLKVLRQLVKLMVDNGLTEVDLEAEGEKIKLKRGAGGEVHYMPAPMPHTPAGMPHAHAASHPVPAAAHDDDDDASSGGGDDGETVTINSPMVGSFYSASSPDADDFVKVGDRVTSDSVVCIIEAMKVFNEIKAEVAGTITEVLVKNGEAVEFGQPLFRVRG